MIYTANVSSFPVFTAVRFYSFIYLFILKWNKFKTPQRDSRPFPFIKYHVTVIQHDIINTIPPRRFPLIRLALSDTVSALLINAIRSQKSDLTSVRHRKTDPDRLANWLIKETEWKF